MIARRRFVAVAAAAAALAACSAPPVPTDSYFRLGPVSPSGPLSAGPIAGTVEVPPFRAEGIVNERAILFRESPQRLVQYSYRFWERPPAVMLQRELIEALRRAQAFDSVVGPELRVDRDYELMGLIRRLEHVVSGGRASVTVEIEIGLRQVRGGRQVLLKTYQNEQSAGNGGIDAAVDAFTRAVGAVFAELLADLDGMPRG